MIKTEYRYLDSNMNPVQKEKANMVEVLTRNEDGTVLESKLIILSG
jgi:hypothetical protein